MPSQSSSVLSLVMVLISSGCVSEEMGCVDDAVSLSVRFDMCSLLRVSRSLLAVAAGLVLAVTVVWGQAPPEQRADIDELKAAIDTGATILRIDVREDYEVESGSMPGAIHIPLGELEARMPDIPKDVRLVFF